MTMVNTVIARANNYLLLVAKSGMVRKHRGQTILRFQEASFVNIRQSFNDFEGHKVAKVHQYLLYTRESEKAFVMPCLNRQVHKLAKTSR